MSKKIQKIDPKNELTTIETRINEWYPQCRMAFSNFLGYRFMIGVALIRAKNLVQGAKPGPKEIGAEEDQQTGFMAWKRSAFPGIPNRTLHDYKVFAERVVTANPNMSELDLAALPEEQRDEVYARLKAAVTGKDVTLCLRAMNEIPDAQAPGGDRGGRRPKKNLVVEAGAEHAEGVAFWERALVDLRLEGIEKKSWKLLNKKEQHKLLDMLISINQMLRAEFKGS